MTTTPKPHRDFYTSRAYWPTFALILAIGFAALASVIL